MRNDSKFELEVRNFQPTYKLVFLNIHDVMLKTLKFVAFPFLKVMDFFNETPRFQSHLNKN